MAGGMWERAAGYFFPKEAVVEFKEKLEMNGGSVQRFLSQSVLAGFALVFAAIALLAWQNTRTLYIILVLPAAFLAPFLFNALLQSYLFERCKRKKEEMVPDLLLHASSFPKGTGFLEIIRKAGRSGFGELSQEFAKVESEVEKGASVERALQNLGKRNKSRVVSRAARLLEQGYKSGADMGDAFREAAVDLLETNALLRERNAALVIEKYTLLFAGGLVVPAILGLLAGLVSGFNLSSLELLEFGMPASERKELLGAVLLANQAYIAEYALLAAVFVSMQEGNTKKAFVYASILLPASLFTYFAASGFSPLW